MQFKHALLCLSAMLPCIAGAQQDSTSINIDEIVIGANKFDENKRNIVQPIQLIKKKDIQWIMPQNTGLLLEQTGNVFVQKSQMGGSSPVIRGFEANRIQMVIDGVRMNNAVYRSGHLQNVITIDNNMLESVEVLYGAGSTLYGSDALGGVIVFNSLKPQFSGDKKMNTKANAMVRYSSANNEMTGHVDVNLGGKKLASITSITFSQFGDLKKGANNTSGYDSLGLRTEYVERVGNVDSIMTNNNPNLQKQSGYSQVDIMEKLLYQQNDKISHGLNLQYSNSSDVPRYDRLTDRRSGKLRWAEWYYGPQERLMASYQFNAKNLGGAFDEIKAGVNYQLIEESRNQRERGKNGLQSRVENIGVLGYNVDLRKLMGKHELTIGTDGQYNTVKSTATETDIVTGDVKPIDTRYPDGGSTMYLGAVYAQHIFKISDKLVLNDGVRVSYVSLNSKFTDKTFFPFPYSEASQQNTALSGNLGLVFMPGKNWRFTLGGSTGFRAPNVDDIGKVFESAAGTQLVVPNPGLKPEYTYTGDLGIAFFVNDKVKIEMNGFYTLFKNAMVLDKFTLNGSDSIVYDGNATAVVAYQNKAEAYIYGMNAAVTVKIVKGLSLYSTINYTYGRFSDPGAPTEVPLDHIPPVFGKTSVMYQVGKFSGEVFALYNGWKRIADYNPFGEDNQQYATPDGMPSWYTLNLRAGYKINRYLGVQVAVENILDQSYRNFASGINAPGRNFVVSLRGSL
jgi:hemoglobin/transferrin/lactoferrin receptor protein